MSKPIFYSASYCPFANRAWLAINYLGVEHEHREVNLSDKGEDFLAVNPAGTVPAFNDNGLHLSESLELTRYFARRYADKKSLLPADLADSEYHLNVALKAYDAELFRPFYGALMAQDPEVQKEKLEALEKVLTKLDGDLAKRGGPFFFGKQLTIVDLAIFPFIERIVHLLSHYRAWQIPEALGNVHRFYNEFLAQEWVQNLIVRRSRQDLDTQPFEKVTRAKYLQEVYSIYAGGDIAGGKAALKGKPAPWKGKEVPADAE